MLAVNPPFQNRGQQYERNIRQILTVNNWLPANLHGNDAGFIHGNVNHYLEVKNRTAPDFGQKRLVYDVTNHRWCWAIPDQITALYDTMNVRNLINPAFIPRRYTVPILNITRADRTFDQQQFEQNIPNLNINTLYQYYQRIGCNYIQIEGKGLYHLQTDAANLGTPQFNMTLVLRLRAKVHHDLPLSNYSFFAVICKRGRLAVSNYDLEGIVAPVPPIVP